MLAATAPPEAPQEAEAPQLAEQAQLAEAPPQQAEAEPQAVALLLLSKRQAPLAAGCCRLQGLLRAGAAAAEPPTGQAAPRRQE